MTAKPLNPLRDTLGWLGLWLITIIINRQWQPLSKFLIENGWHKTGWGAYERLPNHFDNKPGRMED